MADKTIQVHSRSFARLYAMRLLYQMELSEQGLDEILAGASQTLPQDEAEECFHTCDRRADCAQFDFFGLFSTEPKGYALDIVRGVVARQDMIDTLIDEAAQHWALYRMPPVDRAITRIGVWEVWCNDDVPDSVAIDEAVSLAKEYGGEDSSKFVNGVLGKITDSKETDKKVQNG